MALVQISFITFLIAGLVQILNRKQHFFVRDCDERVELKKLKLKADLRQQTFNPILTEDQGGVPAALVSPESAEPIETDRGFLKL